MRLLLALLRPAVIVLLRLGSAVFDAICRRLCLGGTTRLGLAVLVQIDDFGHAELAHNSSKDRRNALLGILSFGDNVGMRRDGASGRAQTGHPACKIRNKRPDPSEGGREKIKGGA